MCTDLDSTLQFVELKVHVVLCGRTLSFQDVCATCMVQSEGCQMGGIDRRAGRLYKVQAFAAGNNVSAGDTSQETLCVSPRVSASLMCD